MKKRKKFNFELETDFKITTDIPFRHQDIIYQLDDETLTIIHKKHWLYRLLLASFHGFMIWINILVLYYTPTIKNIWNVLDLLFWCTLLFITVIFFINDFISKDNIFVFNRIENTITMKAKIINWKNKTITFPFNKARLLFGGYPVTSMKILYPNTFWFTYIIPTGNEDDQDSCLSFFVWYMDRNRPLPPDPRLDPYREKDYRRREKEGFPPPLYPSTIPTPETYIPIKW